MQSKHFRAAASTFICRLLKAAPRRPHCEQGSLAMFSFGGWIGGLTPRPCSGFIPASLARIAATSSCGCPATSRWVGMHPRHLRLLASTFICLLLKGTPMQPHAEHGSSQRFSAGRDNATVAPSGGMMPASAALRFLGMMGVAINEEPVSCVTSCSASCCVGADPAAGMQSRHLRFEGSTFNWRLLKRAPTRPHPEHGSGAGIAFGTLASAGPFFE
eukprot:UN4605